MLDLDRFNQRRRELIAVTEAIRCDLRDQKNDRYPIFQEGKRQIEGKHIRLVRPPIAATNLRRSRKTFAIHP